MSVRLILLTLLIAGPSLGNRGCKNPYLCCVKRQPTGYCTNPGYVPGGNKIILEPIEAPQATLQNNAVGVFGTYLGYGLDTGGAVADIASLTAKFEDWAEALSFGLGVWGSIVGVVASINTPTPQDIIDACNKALVELTDEVNDQFTNMQAYVDQAIMEQDSQLMNLDYKQYHDYFTGCIDETIKDDMYDCIKEAERLSGSDHAKFLRYEDKMNTDWTPTPNEVKHMETLFLTFRDYAELRIMILLTLSGMYENNTTPDGPGAAKRYLTDLKSDVDQFKKYTNFVYNKIYAMHSVDSTYFYNSKVCEDEVREVKEGWGVHTWDFLECNFLFAPMLVDSSTYRCSHDGEVRYKDDCPCEGYDERVLCSKQTMGVEDKSTSYGALFYFNSDIVRPYFDRYTSEMKQSVENFWTANLLVNMKNWQALYDGAVEKLKKYDDVRATPKEEMLSVKNKAKLFEAIERRKMAQKMWGRFGESTNKQSDIVMAGRRSIEKKKSSKKVEL